MFQSPQWGNNSKDTLETMSQFSECFSPRNGEIILKESNVRLVNYIRNVSVPAMGK